MSTTSTIGTSSRNYSTIQSWHDAFTTGGWIGECYNDSEFVEHPNLNGKTTSATDFLTLRCASGQSFKDNANKLTNALKYNASNGVAIRNTTPYNATMLVQESYTTITGLQIKNDITSATPAIQVAGSKTGMVLEQCIVQDAGTSRAIQLSSGITRNCLAIHTNTTGDGIATSYPDSGTKIVNCTSVRPSDVTASGSAYRAVGTGANVTIENCAGFGFTNFSSASTFNGSNNCSDKTISFGTSNQASKTYANQFENTVLSTMDFRLKSGADCIGNGVTDTTNVPNSDDIVGTSRS